MRLAFPAAYLFLVVPAMAVLALYSWHVWPHTGYLTELSVSGAAYSDQNKFRDVFLLPIFLAASILAAAMLWFALKFRVRALPPAADHDARLAIVGRAGTILLLFALGAAGFIGWAVLTGVGFSLAVAQMRLQDDWDRGAATIVLFGCAVALLLENTLRLDPGMVLPLALVSGAALILVLPDPVQVARLLFKFSALLVATAAIFAGPIFWLPTNGGSARVTFVDLPFIFAGILIARAALFDGRADTQKAGRISERGLSLALAAAFALLQTQEFHVPAISEDDYHFGESLIASDWSAHGMLFSRGFPAHGLYDAIGGIFAQLRGEDSATDIIWGLSLFALFCRFAILLSLLRLLGFPLGLIGFALVLPLVQPDRLGEIAIISVLATVGYRVPPVTAGIVTVLVSALGVFMFGGAGVAIAVTGFSLAVLGQYRRDARGFRTFAATSVAIGIIFLAVAHKAVLGWIWYLLESSRANLLLYGLGLETWLSRATNWLEFSLAHAFAVLPLLGIALLVLFSPRITGSWRQFGGMIAMALPLLASALLWNSYAMGRIDPGFPRAAIASLTMGFTFVCWAGIVAPSSWRGLAVVLATLIVLPSTSGNFAIRTPLTPNNSRLPEAPENVVSEGFRIGSGIFSQASLARLERIDAVLASLELGPDEQLGNLTNRSALNYYLDRPLPMALTSAYNSGTRTFQSANLERWHASPPRVFLISADNMEHDGYKLPTRSFEFYRYILQENYSPVVSGELVFAVHDPSPDMAAPKRTVFNLLDVTDVNWTQGIANEVNAGWSIAIDERMRGLVRSGDVLQFSDGTIRTVVVAEGLNLRLDPDEFEGATGRQLTFVSLNRDVFVDPEIVMTGVFRLEHLNRWPSALGRSMSLLEVHSIDNSAPVTLVFNRAEVADGAITSDESGAFAAISGTAFIVDTGNSFVPAETGLLDIELRCVRGSGVPTWRVSWKRPLEPANAMASFTFSSSYFRNLVPLDTNANWFLSPAIEEIRLELLDGGGCETISIGEARLIGRKPLLLDD